MIRRLSINSKPKTNHPKKTVFKANNMAKIMNKIKKIHEWERDGFITLKQKKIIKNNICNKKELFDNLKLIVDDNEIEKPNQIKIINEIFLEYGFVPFPPPSRASTNITTQETVTDNNQDDDDDDDDEDEFGDNGDDDVKESKMIECNSQITIAPCTGLSANDFAEQKASNFWAWDEADPKVSNYPPILGQLFAFYAPPKKNVRKGWVQIHRVKKIRSTKYRLLSWSKNVGQTDRKVLSLTKPLYKMTFAEWDLMGGLKKQQGTYTSYLNKTSRKINLKKKILEKLRDI